MNARNVTQELIGAGSAPHLAYPPDTLFALLAHADKSTRCELRDALASCGLTRVIEAESASEAAKLLRARPIGILVCDLRLPGIDGWRLARMVRCGVFGPNTEIPVVLVAPGRSTLITEGVVKRADLGNLMVLPVGERQLWTRKLQQCLTAPAPLASRRTALIIESDVSVASVAVRVLRRDFAVETAFHGRTGLHNWLARTHDLVLLASDLDDLPATMVLQDILRVRPTQAVVVLSDPDTGTLTESLMSSGATELVTKPFNPSQLRRTCEFAAFHVEGETSLGTAPPSAPRLNDISGGHAPPRRDHHLLDDMETIVLELNARGEFRFLNKAWERVTGYPVAESVGRMLSDFIHPDDRTRVLSIISELGSNGGGCRELRLRLAPKSGRPISVCLSLDRGSTPTGNTTFVWGHITDLPPDTPPMPQITEPMGTYDQLTGLFNRNYFHTCLERLAATSKRGGGPHAIFHVDLDHFKVVNDTLSPRDGDLVLQEVSRLLASRARDRDLLFRIGGDEFALLLPDVGLEHARVIAGDLLESLAHHSYVLGGLRFTVTCSIGVAPIDGTVSTPARYHTHANKASFIAKSRGRNRVHIYSPLDTEHDDLWDSIGWSNKLKEAISDDRLQLYLQPVLSTQSGQLMHFEALLRLHLPNRVHAIGPGAFIPGLERVGQISALDHWVVERALSLLRQRPDLYGLAVNLSAHAFQDDHLLAMIKNKIDTGDINPERLIFEITETASVASIQHAQREIGELRARGCRFALDDFGTGFCSFTYLKHLPADYIKLDGSYIRNIASSDVDLAMVRSVNDIAHLLGKKTIAECVETEATLAVLRDIGVDYVQGFSIGRPLPLHQVQLQPLDQATAH